MRFYYVSFVALITTRQAQSSSIIFVRRQTYLRLISPKQSRYIALQVKGKICISDVWVIGPFNEEHAERQCQLS